MIRTTNNEQPTTAYAYVTFTQTHCLLYRIPNGVVSAGICHISKIWHIRPTR